MLTDKEENNTVLKLHSKEYSELLEKNTRAKTAHFFVSTASLYMYYQYFMYCKWQTHHMMYVFSSTESETEGKGQTTCKCQTFTNVL